MWLFPAYDRGVDIRRYWDSLDPSGRPVLGWLVDGLPRRPDGRVVLLLGAFDPPTNAHLSLASAAGRATGLPAAFCLTRTLLARGEDTLLEPVRRLELLAVLARERGLGLAVSNRGTYLEVARAVGAAGGRAVFVVGSDKLAQIADPRFYRDDAGRPDPDGPAASFREADFVVVPRSGHPVRRADVTLLDPAAVFGDPAEASLSATEVRRRLRSGAEVGHLVPPVVALAVAGYTEAPEPG